MEADYILADESPIKVLDSDKKGSTHQGYQWVYHNPINKLVLFNYRKGRGQHGPKELLAHYRGYLQCDGYVAYDKIGAVPKITLAGCLVHARRKFHDALDSDKIKDAKAMVIFRQIYLEERNIKEQAGQNHELRKTWRDKQIRPQLKNIKK